MAFEQAVRYEKVGIYVTDEGCYFVVEDCFALNCYLSSILIPPKKQLFLFLGGIKHSTSIWVLCQKNNFFAQFYYKFATLLSFFSFLTKKCWKWLFRSAFGVHNTQRLIKIYNILLFRSPFYITNLSDTILNLLFTWVRYSKVSEKQAWC